MITITQRLAATDGRPAGFDYMRIGLAVLIVAFHTVTTSYGIEAQNDLTIGWSRPFWALVLPMFFALSGFLVSGSLERCRTLVSFLGLRLIRLVPALLVESVIAMLLLGPVFTSLPLHAYFSDPELYRYAGNMIGDIHYVLPGVFDSNPITRVNGQLWTLPYELRCYAVIAAVAVLGAYRIRTLMIVACLLLQAYVSYRGLTDIQVGEDHGIVDGRILVTSFLFGSLLCRLRGQIPYSGVLGLASAAVSAILLGSHALSSFAALPVAYLTVYLGLLNPPRNAAISGGDYSYGIFLYGYPIQQAVSALLPEYRIWWVNLLVALPITVGVAYVSWHAVEKQALKLRPALKRIEQHWIPVNDGILMLCGRLMPSGLRARWVPTRS